VDVASLDPDSALAGEVIGTVGPRIIGGSMKVHVGLVCYEGLNLA